MTTAQLWTSPTALQKRTTRSLHALETGTNSGFRVHECAKTAATDTKLSCVPYNSILTQLQMEVLEKNQILTTEQPKPESLNKQNPPTAYHSCSTRTEHLPPQLEGRTTWLIRCWSN